MQRSKDMWFIHRFYNCIGDFNCFPLLTACIVCQGTMKTRSQERGYQVSITQIIWIKINLPYHLYSQNWGFRAQKDRWQRSAAFVFLDLCYFTHTCLAHPYAFQLYFSSCICSIFIIVYWINIWSSFFKTEYKISRY